MSELSELIFKIIFHDVPHDSQLYTMGFPELAEEGGGSVLAGLRGRQLKLSKAGRN